MEGFDLLKLVKCASTDVQFRGLEQVAASDCIYPPDAELFSKATVVELLCHSKLPCSGGPGERLHPQLGER